jgi:hypothetical protein
MKVGARYQTASYCTNQAAREAFSAKQRAKVGPTSEHQGAESRPSGLQFKMLVVHVELHAQVHIPHILVVTDE